MRVKCLLLMSGIIPTGLLKNSFSKRAPRTAEKLNMNAMMCMIPHNQRTSLAAEAFEKVLDTKAPLSNFSLFFTSSHLRNQTPFYWNTLLLRSRFLNLFFFHEFKLSMIFLNDNFLLFFKFLSFLGLIRFAFWNH